MSGDSAEGNFGVVMEARRRWSREEKQALVSELRVARVDSSFFVLFDLES